MLFQTPEFAIFLIITITLVAVTRLDSRRKLVLLAATDAGGHAEVHPLRF